MNQQSPPVVRNLGQSPCFFVQLWLTTGWRSWFMPNLPMSICSLAVIRQISFWIPGRKRSRNVYNMFLYVSLKYVYTKKIWIERERESHLLALDMARKDRQKKGRRKTLPSLVARFVVPGLTASPDTLCWVGNHFENSSLRSVQGGYGTSTPSDSTSKKPCPQSTRHDNVKKPYSLVSSSSSSSSPPHDDHSEKLRLRNKPTGSPPGFFVAGAVRPHPWWALNSDIGQQWV